MDLSKYSWFKKHLGKSKNRPDSHKCVWQEDDQFMWTGSCSIMGWRWQIEFMQTRQKGLRYSQGRFGHAETIFCLWNL